MRRLSEGRPVVVDLAEEAIECVVEGLDGDEATIAPRIVADAAYIPSVGRAAALVFEDGEARGRIEGAVRRAEAEGRLAFTAGGADALPPRRRTARTGAKVPVELTPLDEDGAPLIRRPVPMTTVDVSIGGQGVVASTWPAPEGSRVRFDLRLPDGPPISGIAQVLRTAQGVAGMAFVEMSADERMRLAAFLIAERGA